MENAHEITTGEAAETSWETRVFLLQRRAEGLRRQADELSGPLAITYRRRAAELELEAFALGMRLAPPGREPKLIAA